MGKRLVNGPSTTRRRGKLLGGQDFDTELEELRLKKDPTGQARPAAGGGSNIFQSAGKHAQRVGAVGEK